MGQILEVVFLLRIELYEQCRFDGVLKYSCVDSDDQPHCSQDERHRATYASNHLLRERPPVPFQLAKEPIENAWT